jgi:hypothetical protein
MSPGSHHEVGAVVDAGAEPPAHVVLEVRRLAAFGVRNDATIVAAGRLSHVDRCGAGR